MINNLSKDECKSFLQLAYLAIFSNGKVDENEEKVFVGYSKKLGIDFVPDEYKSVELDDVISEISKYESKSQRIILAETIGVLYSDEIYDDSEKSFVKQVGEKLGFSEIVVLSIEEAVYNYISAYDVLIKAVE